MLELRRRLDELSYAPCPETGLYAGLEGIKNWGRLHTTERDADTDEITNEFTDNGDPLGGGIVVGYNFRPWHDSIVLGPFGSFDWLDQTVKHTFGGGSFLGTESNWIATVGGKAGVTTASGLFFYGLAGASWLNTDLNVRFATASSAPPRCLALRSAAAPSIGRARCGCSGRRSRFSSSTSTAGGPTPTSTNLPHRRPSTTPSSATTTRSSSA
jgi:opacity protein-like surface antigen